MSEQTYILTKEQKDGLTDFVRTEMSKRNVGWAQAILHDLAKLPSVEDTRPLAESKPVVALEEMEDCIDQGEKTWMLSGANQLGHKVSFVARRVLTLLQSRTPSVGELDLSKLETMSAWDAGHRFSVDERVVRLSDLQALIKGGGL